MPAYFSSLRHLSHIAARRAGRSAGRALLVVCSLVATTPVLAQEHAAPGPVSPDSADVIRSGLNRPPASYPADARDVLALPLAAVVLPLRLVAAGFAIVASGVAQLLPRGEGPNIYEAMVAWGLTPSIRALGYGAGDGVQFRLDRYNPFFIELAASVIQSPGAGRVALGLTNDDRSLDGGTAFRRLTEAKFYGIGIDSNRDDESNYEWRQFQVGATWEAEASKWLKFASVGGWERNETDEGHHSKLPDIRETFDSVSLFGSQEALNYGVIGTTATFDFTHSKVLQPRGVRFITETYFYGGTGSTDSDFVRLQGEVQGYVPFNERQEFALRAIVESNPGSGRAVPFYYLAELGGNDVMRGYPVARFRDRDRLTWTVEWRYEAWRELQERARAEWFVFWDAGTVMPSISEITDFKHAWGFGLRFATLNGPGANFFFAWGQEEFRFAFRFISAF